MLVWKVLVVRMILVLLNRRWLRGVLYYLWVLICLQLLRLLTNGMIIIVLSIIVTSVTLLPQHFLFNLNLPLNLSHNLFLPLLGVCAGVDTTIATAATTTTTSISSGTSTSCSSLAPG